LVTPVFGSFFAARLLTSIGVWLHSVVAAIAAFDYTHSAVAVGIVSLVQFTPQLILAPLSGKWADRGDVKRQMLIGRVLCAFGSGSLAVSYLVRPDIDGWAMASIVSSMSLVVGLGLVIGGPAMQSGIPLLVSRDELPAAMALNTAPITIGRIAGPAIGAIAAAGLGYEYAFLLASAMQLAFIALVVWIKFPTPEGKDDTEEFSVREAISFVRRDRPTLLILVGVTMLGLGSEPTVTLAPPLAAELGRGTESVGALTSSMGIGAAFGVFLASLAARHLRNDISAPGGMMLMAIGLASCTFPLGMLPAFAAFGVIGLGFILAVSALSTLLQMRIPPVLRGRLMALWLMGFLGSRPLGAMTVGAVADWTSVHAAFGCVASAMLVAAFMCRPSQLRNPSSNPGQNEPTPSHELPPEH